MPQRPDAAKQRHWLDLVQRWQRSRLTVRAFCDREDLSEPSFYAWRGRLRQRGLLGQDPTPRASAPPAFVKVTVTPEVAAPAPSAIDLLLPRGRRLRVRPGFDAALLRQLLRLLEEPPC